MNTANIPADETIGRGASPSRDSVRERSRFQRNLIQWNPRVIISIEGLPGSEVEGLARWPDFAGTETKFIPLNIACDLVSINFVASEWDLSNATSDNCYKYGSAGRTGRKFTGGMHPCGNARCRNCAIQKSAILLRHLYLRFLGREIVHVYEVPLGIWRQGSLRKQVSRAFDVEYGGSGQYTVFLRDDDEMAYVYASAAITGAFAKYLTDMDAPSALEHVRDLALRLPWINNGQNRRWATSSGWKLPKHVKRDANYLRVTHQTEIEVFDEQRWLLITNDGLTIEKLSVDDMDRYSIAAARITPMEFAKLRAADAEAIVRLNNHL